MHLSFPALPLCCDLTHALSPSPEMPSDRWMRGWTQSFSLLLVTVAAVAPAAAAAAAGVSTSCAPPPSCSLITAVRQLCLGGSHSIVLAPPSPKGAPVGVGAALPAPAHERDRFQITVILGTYVAQSMLHLRLFLSPFFLPGQSLLLSLCCRPPPSCYCLCCRSARLCCTQTKSSNPASSVCQRLSLSPATVVFFSPRASPAFS